MTDSTVASAANATTESGGEAEIAGGVGVRRGAATRSLRSDRGVAHSGAPPDFLGTCPEGLRAISFLRRRVIQGGDPLLERLTAVSDPVGRNWDGCARATTRAVLISGQVITDEELEREDERYGAAGGDP